MIVEAHQVTKRYRQQRRTEGILGALKAIALPSHDYTDAVLASSFAIGAGEAVAYLGPNGAGKSTMIKMMTGVLAPTSGSLRVLGRTPHDHRVQNAREIGVVFGQRSQLWWDLPLASSFSLHRRIYSLDAGQYRSTLDYLVAALGLASFIDRPVRQLSLGQRMRGEFALSLLHRPKILFLDEPTIGLDIEAKQQVRALLRRVNAEMGTALVLTSHDLQDIEQVCSRLILVDRGAIVFDGTLQALQSMIEVDRIVTIEFDADPGPLTTMTARLCSTQLGRRSFALNRGATMLDLLDEVARLASVRDVSFVPPRIEDVVQSFYRQRVQ